MGIPKVLEEPFRLTNLDPVISSANGVATYWSDLWTYQVPNGVALILKPTDTFSLYLDSGTGSTEAPAATTSIKIEKRDASKSDILLAYGPTFYLDAKEFQDVNKLARLRITGDSLVINEREFLIISAKTAAVTLAVAYCYFVIHTTRIRKAIGA